MRRTKRPPANEPALIAGRKAEEKLNSLFKKGLNYKWLNREDDAYLDHDFELYLKRHNGKKSILECENKDPFYKQYFSGGIHYQAAKVYDLIKYAIPAYYCLLIPDGNFVELYFLTAKNIVKYSGKPKPVNTSRQKGELFYKVPENKVKYFSWTIDPIEVFI